MLATGGRDGHAATTSRLTRPRPSGCNPADREPGRDLAMTRTVRTAPLALLMFIAVACGSGAQPSASLAPATFSDYDAAFCGAFTSLIRAYGNPDTDAPSAMRKALDDSVAAGDRAAADVCVDGHAQRARGGPSAPAHRRPMGARCRDRGPSRPAAGGVRGMDFRQASTAHPIPRHWTPDGIRASRRDRRLDGDHPRRKHHTGSYGCQPGAMPGVTRVRCRPVRCDCRGQPRRGRTGGRRRRPVRRR